MEIKFTEFKDGTNWCHGKIGEYDFSAKLFDEGSTFGIDNGRVSKLSIYNDDIRQREQNFFKACIVNYDRGWDIKPKGKEQTEIYCTVLKFLEKAPKRFENEEE